jgi:hypothetical protein
MYIKAKKVVLFLLVTLLPIGLLISFVSSDLNTSATDTLTPYESSTELTLDGLANEAAWGSATPLTVTTTMGTLAGTQVTLKAVYTSTNIYVLASWADSTFSITRGRYNVSGGIFNEKLSEGGSEDRIALLWEIGTVDGFNVSGGAVKCHGFSTVNLSAGEKADMWHIKAARGGGYSSATTTGITIDPTTFEVTAGTVNLVGYADDKFVDETDRHGDDGDSPYKDNTNGTHAAWIEASPTDWIDAMILTETEINNGEAINITEALTNSWANLTTAVNSYVALNANVPRHILRMPTDSHGDIEVGMTWNDGVWTVETKRALDTMNNDDVIFDDTTAGEYLFSLAIMDNEGQEDEPPVTHSTYSGPIALTFTTPGNDNGEPAIPGFNLLIFIGSISAISIILLKVRSKSKDI